MEEPSTVTAKKIDTEEMDDHYNPMSEHYFSRENSSMTQLTKLYITNVSKVLTEKGLRNIFGNYGKIIFSCIRTKSNGHRYALVRYDSREAACLAKQRVHNASPHCMKIQFARCAPKLTEQEEEMPESVIAVPENITEKPRLYPHNITSSTETFLNSAFYKSIKDPEGSHNRAMIMLGSKKQHSQKFLEHRKRIAALSQEELTKPYIYNGLDKYNLCNYCNQPAAFKLSDQENIFYCSQYCQQSKCEELLYKK